VTEELGLSENVFKPKMDEASRVAEASTWQRSMTAFNPASFGPASISTAGSTATGLVVGSPVQVAPNDGTTFEVTITATGSGTILASIPVGARSYVPSSFGTTGTGAQAIAVDSFDNLYVANGLDDTVTQVTPGGASSVFGTTGSNPYGITTDPIGNVYTANNASNNVTKITSGGVSSILGTTDSNPDGVVLDVAGNVYAVNNGTNNISKITPAGVSGILGTTGAAPQALTMDSAGNIYTVNFLSNNVTKITPAGVGGLSAAMSDNENASIGGSALTGAMGWMSAEKSSSLRRLSFWNICKYVYCKYTQGEWGWIIEGNARTSAKGSGRTRPSKTVEGFCRSISGG
jgi:streptogramin lyase